ncbi:MAG: M20/M25/M40 family metallo-hydrolase [Actinobacteria bacterium]|nr:M20/M25/M40 family metallo-hydrolase [Actinomycetota bacterium]
MTSLPASPALPVDVAALGRDAVDLAARILRIDSTNGNETAVAEVLAEHLEGCGAEVELVARDPLRANLVARLRGSGGGPSLALVGHTDVVPADARDWTHPPFAGVVDDDGYLWGRGAVDMKNEVAARTAAFAALGRSGWHGAGDLLLVMVADEEDGSAEVGMNWLVHERPDIAADYALNEGGGAPLHLQDGRLMVEVAVGEKGTCPVLVEALGEAGHASVPGLGRNAVPVLGALLARLGRGDGELRGHPVVVAMLDTLLGAGAVDRLGLEAAVAQAGLIDEYLSVGIPALASTTMAPTMLHGSTARNVMPARAGVELDCRTLPGTSEEEVLAAVRRALGDDLPYALSLVEPPVHGNASEPGGPLWDLVSGFVAERVGGAALPTMCTGFTDSVYLRREFGTVAYGFSPYATTPQAVLESGYHNRDERVHVDDIALSAEFHAVAAVALLG